MAVQSGGALGTPVERNHRGGGPVTMGTRIAGTILLALALFLFGSAGASAAETRTGDDVSVPRGEQIDGDLYLLGGEVIIAGIVNGDLTGAAESIRITGTVNGSVNVVSGSLDITGTVANSVRVSAGTVDIEGAVGGDLIVAAGDVTVTTDGAIGGDLLVASGDVTVRGPVEGDVRGSAGDVTIDASVGGSVRLSAAGVTIAENGSIAGDLRYASNEVAAIDDGATIRGQTIRSSSFRSTGGPDIFSALTGQLARLLVGLVTGLVLLVLIPNPIVGTSEIIRKRFFGSAAAGMVGMVTWPIVAILMTIIVVGIPIAVIGTVLLLCIAYLSQVFVGLALGRFVLPDSWRTQSRGYNILAMAIGMIIIGAIRSVPVPYVSGAVALVAALLGVGGVLLSFHTRAETPLATS